MQKEKKAETFTVETDLKDRYLKKAIPAMMKEFHYQNPMQVPRLEKIVVNVGMGEAISNMKALDTAMSELSQITGQKSILTKAKKSIAGFKLRAGMPVGCKVTLRREKMYYFFHRLLHTALPRIRDFRGVSTKAFDGQGNYTLGIKEQLVFPEINYDDVVAVHGMDIVLVTSANNNKEGMALLRYLGMPFRN